MGRKELGRETGSKATFSVLSLELSNVLHNKTQNLSKREASKTRKTKQKQKQKKPNFMADMMAHAWGGRGRRILVGKGRRSYSAIGRKQ